MAKTSKPTLNTPAIQDVKINWIEDDIEKVQTKPNLYLQQYGTAGANHMGREIIQNAYDECIDIHSQGSNVTVVYDKAFDKLTVTDDGRGFPETDYPLDIFCTKLQSGSKGTRNQSGSTSGEFGVGMTVTCALSKIFEITTYRQSPDNYIHTVKFDEGKKVSDKIVKNPKGLHGSSVSYIPNPKYLGKGTKIDIHEMYNWLNDISYLLGAEKKKITTNFELWDGKTLKKKEKIKSKPFSDLIKSVCKSPAMDPFIVKKSTTIVEEDINGKKTKKNVNLEVAFCYDNKINPDEVEKVISYCNYTRTTNGGTHEQAVDESICRFLQSATKAGLSDKEKEKTDILWQDVRTNLRIVINLNSNAQVQFVGNAKTEIGNKDLIPVIKDLMTSAFEDFEKKQNTLLQSYTKYVKRNAKARIELNKIRNVNTKPKTNAFLDHLDSNFTPCNNRGKMYKEIYLVEGQRSAMGSVVDGRNPDVQAVLGFRGVTANAYKRDVTNIFDNAEWKNYCQKINFDIKNPKVEDVKYDKIIIATDADSDGHGIASGIGAFHAKFALDLVKAGKLYRVYPPLYRIKDNKHPFMRTKKELIDYYLDTILKKFTVEPKSYKKADIKFSKSDFKTFVYDTEYYHDRLVYLGDHYSVSRGLIEITGFNLTMYGLVKGKRNFDPDKTVKLALSDQKFITTLMNDVQKFYKEIIYDEKSKSLRGVIDGSYQALNITTRFAEKTYETFGDIWSKYGLYLSYSENDSKKVNSTIGGFLEASLKYQPKIEERYKGLGEADWKDIGATIMDPSKRILVQLTVDDVKKDLREIELLFASTSEARLARKKMMKAYKVDPDEIDN